MIWVGKGTVIAKGSSFVFWAKRKEHSRDFPAEVGVGLLALSPEEHRCFAQSMRLFGTERGTLRLARPLFNKHRSSEMSRSRVRGRGNTEPYFSAIC